MEIYLPIAEQSMNVFVLLGLGAAAGLLAGMFGVGGGFLATPLLIFVGIPPAVAVASQANQVIANSVSSLQVQWRRGNVDLRMGLILLLGGMFGSTAGVSLFTYLKRIGQIDFVIAVLYVVMLSAIGLLMLFESLRTYLRRRRNPEAPRGKLHTHYLVHRLPLKLRFYKSKLYISALLPLGIGFAIGVLSAILGVGGGFVLVPAMIYLLGMPTGGRDRHLELPDPVRRGQRHLPAGRHQRHRRRRAGAAADPGRRCRRAHRVAARRASCRAWCCAA